MCGLVGLAGTIQKNELEMFQDLIIADAVRGTSSTGVASVARSLDAETILAKEVGDPFVLLGSKQWDKAVKLGIKALIGHNRYATVGKAARWNAHPFDFPGLVGAHNGTLDWGYKNKLLDADKFDTDSEALYHTMTVRGPKETIESVTGAWALTWYDKAENRINFLRNKERPLTYAFSEGREILFWASEPLMLKWAAARRGVKLEEDTVFLVPEDTLLSVVVPVFGKPFEKFDRKHIQGGIKQEYKYGPKQGGAGGYAGAFQRTNIAINKRVGPAIAKVVDIPPRDQEYLINTDVAFVNGRRNVYCNGVVTGTVDHDEAVEYCVFFKHPNPPKEEGSTDTPFLLGPPSQSPNESPGKVSGPSAGAGKKKKSVTIDNLPEVDDQPKEDTSNVLPFFRGSGGGTRRTLSKQHFEKITNNCCAWLGCDVDHESEGLWLDAKTFVCAPCIVGDSELKDMFNVANLAIGDC